MCEKKGMVSKRSGQDFPKYLFTFAWKRYQRMIPEMMIPISAPMPLVKRSIIPITRLIIVMMTPTVHTQPHALKHPIPRMISIIPTIIRIKPNTRPITPPDRASDYCTECCGAESAEQHDQSPDYPEDTDNGDSQWSFCHICGFNEGDDKDMVDSGKTANLLGYRDEDGAGVVSSPSGPIRSSQSMLSH